MSGRLTCRALLEPLPERFAVTFAGSDKTCRNGLPRSAAAGPTGRIPAETLDVVDVERSADGEIRVEFGVGSAFPVEVLRLLDLRLPGLRQRLGEVGQLLQHGGETTGLDHAALVQEEGFLLRCCEAGSPVGEGGGDRFERGAGVRRLCGGDRLYRLAPETDDRETDRGGLEESA
ncbi:MAG: hypothetical protein IPN83_00060 [Holophagales bacterium]|nr:hypothetical protein [Holophagales bacterium]